MDKTRFPGVHNLAPGKYLLRWEQRDPKTGKLRDRRKRVRARSAQDAHDKRREEMANDGATMAQRHTLGDFAASWLAGKMPNLSPTTRDTYTQALEHITGFVFKDGRCFGDFYMDAIEHDDVLAYREQGKKGYRNATVNGRLRVLGTLCADAIVTLGLQRDPTLRVDKLPEQGQRRARVLSTEELRALLAWMRDEEKNPQWYPLALALAVTGMRWSEAAGLKWPDLDYRKRTITIRRRNLRGKIREGTKNGRKIFRVVPMAPELGEVLRAHHKRLAKLPHMLASGFVFPDENGGPYKGGSGALDKPYKRAAAGTELGRKVSSHDMRHTWNDILRKVTDDEVQMAITGHSTAEMKEHYSHVSQDERMEATSRGLRLIMGG